MPSIVGGRQDHPAYMPRAMGPDEDLVGDRHCTVIKSIIDDQLVFRCERVSGETYTQRDPPTDKLKRRIAQLKRTAKRAAR